MNEKSRCSWCGDEQLLIDYHDTEWGVVTTSDEKQFEFLVLGSAQAGLSWRTVLYKRECYRKYYKGFDAESVARYTEREIKPMLADPGMIRNRKKIEASISNAVGFLKITKEFGSFYKYLLNFTGGKTITNRWKDMSEVPASTELSLAISRDLKKRCFRFMGPTILYAHLQATGIVNDHMVSCFRHAEVSTLSQDIK